jgi:hypothetical protein
MSVRKKYAFLFFACLAALALPFLCPAAHLDLPQGIMLFCLMLVSGCAWLATPLSVEEQMIERDIFEHQCVNKIRTFEGDEEFWKSKKEQVGPVVVDADSPFKTGVGQ